MSSLSPHNVVTRHCGQLWRNLAARTSKLRFSGLPVAAPQTVSLIWMYSYDPAASHPDWKQLKKATAHAVVQPGGTVDFVLYLGASSTEGEPENVSVLFVKDHILQRSSLPTLSYVLSSGDPVEDGFKAEGRLKVSLLWGDTVVLEAEDIFNRHSSYDSLTTSAVIEILKTTWDTQFKLFQDEACQIPTLTTLAITQILRTATDADPLPDAVTRLQFCGRFPCKQPAIWGVFQNLLELLLRSAFLRQLFTAEQLILGGTDELALRVESPSFPPEHDSPFHIFRLPTSARKEPGLFVELFSVTTPDPNILKPLRPSPYVTAEQLRAAAGDPYTAFANLEKARSLKLAALVKIGDLHPMPLAGPSVEAGGHDQLEGLAPGYPPNHDYLFQQ